MNLENQMDSSNTGMKRYEPYATAGEFEDLAPPLTIKEAAKIARKFLKNLPDDLIDADMDTEL